MGEMKYQRYISTDESVSTGSDESEATGSDESEATGSDESEATGSDESEATGSDESEATGSDESEATGSHKFKIMVLVSIIIIGFIALRTFLVMDSTFILGCFILPFTFVFHQKERSNRWFILGVFFLITAFFIPSYTLFYVALVGCFLGFFENMYGKQTLLLFLTFITISPIFRYFSDIFTFDIRLILTEIAAKILRFFDPSVLATGNVIQAKGQDWQIDEACMGLNMLGLAFILTYFFCANFAKAAKKRPILRGLLLTILLAFLLNTLANLTRIMGVVYFKILPATQGHDAIGLLSLVFYNLVPLYFFVQKSVSWAWFFEPLKESGSIDILSKNNIQNIVFQCIILFLIIYKGVDITLHKPQNNRSEAQIEVEGFKSETRADGVTKLSNDSVLIYVKNLNYFFTTEHSPMICWKGSGYVFQKIEKMTVDNFEFYTGILQKDGSKIYTAWWFESAHNRTIEQTVWRKNMLLKNEHYKLVNVNVENPILLPQMVRTLKF
jgi:exosortase N